MKKFNSLAIFLLFLFSSFFVSLDSVSAQNAGIGISPVKIEEVVDPGEVLRTGIRVTNNGTSGTILYVYLKDFKAEGETGTPKLIAPGSEDGYYLASWIDITDEGISFAAKEEKYISFNINVPENTGPGGYYGAIYFGTKPPKINIEGEEKGAGMSVGQQTGCLILLQVSGDVEEEAIIREFTTDKNFYSTPFDVEFLLRVENLGNVHVKPMGNITIKNMLGREVQTLQVNDNGGNVLPSSIRRFSENWEGKNGFGKYEAEIGLSYGTPASDGGNGKQSIFSVVTFWILPWRIIIPLGLSVIFTTALMLLFLRFYKNKAIRRAMQQAGVGQVRYVKKFKGPSPTAHLAMVLIVVFLVVFVVISGIYLVLFS